MSGRSLGPQFADLLRRFNIWRRFAHLFPTVFGAFEALLVNQSAKVGPAHAFVAATSRIVVFEVDGICFLPRFNHEQQFLIELKALNLKRTDSEQPHGFRLVFHEFQVFLYLCRIGAIASQLKIRRSLESFWSQNGHCGVAK